jgi:hypothetical protein
MDEQDSVITGIDQETVTEPDQDNPVEPEKATEPTQEKTEAKPEKSEVPAGVQKRINKLTAKNYALEEQLRQERLKNQDLSKEPEAPDIVNFIDQYGNVDNEAYKQAVGIYNEKRDNWKEAQTAMKEEVVISAQEMAQHQAKFIEKGAKLAEKYPDWYSLLNKNIWTEELKGYLWSTENAELALYLGKHEEEAKRIGALGRRQGIDAMEAELEAIETRMKTPLRNAGNPPPPISPVDDDTSTSIKDLHSIKDPDKWYEEWKRQKIKKLG